MGRAARAKSVKRGLDDGPGRRPSGAERRARARRRVSRRRTLRYVVPSAILLGVVAVALALSRGGGGAGAPAATGRVSVGGPSLPQPLSVGSVVPDFSAPGLTGTTVRWSDRAGAPAVLAVWAPWCPHCQKEMPVLARLAEEFPGMKLITIVTAADLHPGPTATEYMRSHALSFPVAVDDASGTIGSAMGVTGFPTVYYVARGGTVAATQVGEWSESQMRDAFGQAARS